jgi:CTD kinase subunit alpha
MARSRRSPLMRDQWRAEEDAYDRHSHRYRESDRSDRRPRTPPPTRRDDRDEHYRSREPIAVESYRPTSSREIERQSRKSQARAASPSPRRHSKSKPSIQKSRPLEERITRPHDTSPAKSTKRKRTRSPSPTRSDRYVPSRRRSHSRERSDFRDRRGQGTDRAFSPRRLSPTRNPRLDGRSEVAPSDSYFSTRYRRDESRSSRTRVQRRSRSPRRHSRSPPPHRTKTRSPRPASRELSPYSARARKTQNQATHDTRGSDNSMNPQRIQSIVSDSSHPQPQSQRMQGYNRGGHDPMDGHTPMRQNFTAHNHNMIHQNRPPRPFVDTRPPYSGSPPFMTPNSSYHGSPQSGSPHYGNRGGWGGQQPYQGHHGYGDFLAD